MTTQELVLSGAGTLISLLLACLIFFMKRLIDKIDATDKTASEALRVGKEQGKNIAEMRKSQSRVLSEIKNEIKDLRRLEIDVAVLTSAMRIRRSHTPEVILDAS